MDVDDQEYNQMDQIIPNLWIGSLLATKDVENLRENNIHSVLSAMRGSVKIHETFLHFQVQLEDDIEADALALFPQCIAFIEKELERGHGVLVHCQAGMSRSATIVAAYLMYANHLDAQAALEMIRKARPQTEPNEGFLYQLDVFYEASFKVSRNNKATRMYYLERALEEVMSAGGAVPENNMFPKFPRTPSDSMPPTPGGQRRRIRCKMCRQELAAREHMLDHGEVGPDTPASAISMSPAISRRPSGGTQERPLQFQMTSIKPLSRSSSMGAGAAERLAKINTSDDSAVGPSRRFSNLAMTQASASRSGSVGQIDMQPLVPSRRGSMATRSRRPSALASEIHAIREGMAANSTPSDANPSVTTGTKTILEMEKEEDLNQSALDTDSEDDDPEPHPKASKIRKLPAKEDDSASGRTSSFGARDARGSMSRGTAFPPTPTYKNPSELAQHLNNHPNLAALRSPGIVSSMGGMGGIQPMTKINTPPTASPTSYFKQSPPLITNNACSGYFVEPMKWMESFLEKGAVGGKIICPNKNCNAKLGNYDWAGVQCSCKQWVVPGFCIHRSKVDEIG